MILQGREIPADIIAEYEKRYRSNLKPEWIGTIYGIRDWDYAAAIVHAPLSPSDIILDIGCGESNFLALAAEEVAQAWGIDNNTFANYDDWFATLEDFEVYRSGKMKVLTQSARELPFPDNYFDKIFTFSALEHFLDDDDIQCAQEVGRVLKPGGIFCGTVDHNPDTEYGATTEYRSSYTVESFIRRLLLPSGLTLCGNTEVPWVKVTQVVALFFMMRKEK